MEQTKAVYRRYEALLKENGLRLENILNGNIYCQDITMQDEYEQQWIRWTYPGHKPAGTMVEGRPADRRDLLALGLTFADSPEIADVKRVKPAENCCRYVEYRKTAYFTGHVCLDADAKDPVSYTHLDVYKRQWIFWKQRKKVWSACCTSISAELFSCARVLQI